MGTMVKLVILVLTMMTCGEAKEDSRNIVKEMQTEIHKMNERLALTEETLMKTKEDYGKTQDALKKTNKELIELKTKNIQLEEHINMTEDDLKMKDQELKRELSFLKSPPIFHVCGAHFEQLHINSQTIPYDSFIFPIDTNIEGGDLDLSSGVLTSPSNGVYTVTWSLLAHSDNNWITIFLRKNGQNIKDSNLQFFSRYNSYQQGGRTILVSLERGDTLDLFCEGSGNGIFHITFCVSLTTY